MSFKQGFVLEFQQEQAEHGEGDLEKSQRKSEFLGGVKPFGIPIIRKDLICLDCFEVFLRPSSPWHGWKAARVKN